MITFRIEETNLSDSVKTYAYNCFEIFIAMGAKCSACDNVATVAGVLMPGGTRMIACYPICAQCVLNNKIVSAIERGAKRQMGITPFPKESGYEPKESACFSKKRKGEK